MVLELDGLGFVFRFVIQQLGGFGVSFGVLFIYLIDSYLLNICIMWNEQCQTEFEIFFLSVSLVGEIVMNDNMNINV